MQRVSQISSPASSHAPEQLSPQSATFRQAHGNSEQQARLGMTEGSPAPSLEEIRRGDVAELGDSGPAISQIQVALSRLGFGVQVTGQLGSTTQSVIQDFQRAYRVQATGKIGATTLSALDQALRCSVTLEELKTIGTNISDADARAWLPQLNASMAYANISTDARKAAYIAQLAHETDGFNTFEEYASGSDYEGREDLGNTQPGDGRRFKGRGAIQLTGRANYAAASQRLGVDLVSNPELAKDPRYAFLVSADYWSTHGLNDYADRGDFEGITDVINYYDPESRRRSRRSYHQTAQQTLAAGADLSRVEDLGPPAAGSALGSGVGSTPSAEAHEVTDLILAGQLRAAQQTAARLASGIRSATGLKQGDPHPVTDTLGSLWQIAHAMGVTQEAVASSDFGRAKSQAHHAAETARALRARAAIVPEDAERIIAAAGGWWTRASQGEQSQPQGASQSSDRGRYGVFTTGRSRGGQVTSQELDRSGRWSTRDLLSHHSDRSNSWAANNIRNSKNQDLQAYDFTFERTDQSGAPIAGSAHGLPLMAPADMKVIDIHKAFEGSGGYGKFIALEDVETGLRIEVHHLDSVGDFRVGQILKGGTTIGTQGGSGNTRSAYATHVDIVGTEPAVEQFVRSNQGGTFRTRQP